MKTHPTIAGNAYVVFSKTGCTVTDSTGTLNKEVPAGDWLSIPAPSDALILSDDNAIVRNANFKLALAPSSVGSGGGSTGGGEPEGDYLLFNADRSVRGGKMDNVKDVTRLMFNVTSQKEWNINFPNATKAEATFEGCTNMTTVRCDMPLVTDFSMTYLNCTSLSEFYGTLENASSCYNMFSKCVLDKGSVLRIAQTIKSFTGGWHGITLGIHIDHKYDPDVNAALKRLDANYEPLNLPIDEATGEYIEITESKGWSISVQWNGTATENAYPNPAATYSLRPQVTPVYAKRGEDFDGKPMLDWGHYVTNWEENGYMEFASLEEAREYFNIAE